MAKELKDALLTLPNDHPLQIAVRTYSLALSLSLGPAILSLVASPKARSKGLPHSLKAILQRELHVTGFPFAITVALGGGSALRALWKRAERRKREGSPEGDEDADPGHLTRLLEHLKPWHKSFICNALASLLAITLLQSRRRSAQTRKAHIPWTVPIAQTRKTELGRMSASLDLTLLVLVRAFDALTQRLVFNRAGDETKQARKRRHSITTKLDALAFWASSARIMWCFFYKPERLPGSYVKWITSLANVDEQIIVALRAIRTGRWSYLYSSTPSPNPVALLSQRLGYPAKWGDPKILPAYGGYAASAIWKELGVRGRGSLGGIPCELVHGSVAGGSCTANFTVRGLHAFLEALVLYLPVHVLPILLRKPRKLLSFPAILDTLLGILRSASFLSGFVSSFWAAVCITRTLLVARLFPYISHDFYDGPFGCVLAGCLACGSSIWIESGRRRGEMALYVLPRAIRACLPDRWLRSGSKSVYAVERIVFTASLATLLTSAVHQPETLRGLSRWTLGFILQGPNALRWRRKSVNTSSANEKAASSINGVRPASDKPQ
ncbi:hypothetical protein BC834DRAFT_814581 [Gloeopeniophorella convolvens]|nr:hypothetical protein BC834DRAFT_814581 [Gloeopeniophorella convolvens]